MLDRMAGKNLQICCKIYVLKRKETNKPTRMDTYFYPNTSAHKTIFINDHNTLLSVLRDKFLNTYAVL